MSRRTKIHFAGICGTFMAGLALIARELGFEVEGTDLNVYPPMSDVLADAGIDVNVGWSPSNLSDDVDEVIIGNALSRGNELVEHVLDRQIPFTSGAQWLFDRVLRDRWVIAVSGTHGKTTTSSLLATILEHAGLEPGFLIGGSANDFAQPARLGASPYFVIEADEYDTAFFDKRSKFVHYRPKTLIINNIEFDHADIFPDLEAIIRQFHHLVRTVPRSGAIIAPGSDSNVHATIAMGCWTPVEWLPDIYCRANEGDAAHTLSISARNGSTIVSQGALEIGPLELSLPGRHNLANALAAIAAARHIGVRPEVSVAALAKFSGVKRRLELRGRVGDIAVYDDFAHHPTAIEATIDGLRDKIGSDARILAVLEMRSNTMRDGHHRDTLAASLSAADAVYVFAPEQLDWSVGKAMQPLGNRCRVATSVDTVVAMVVSEARPTDHVLIMSNGSFEGIHGRILDELEQNDD